MECCVTPIAQIAQTPSASTIIWATCFSVSTGTTPFACHFKREAIEAFSVFFNTVDPLIEKFGICQSVVKDIARDGGKADEVCTGPWMQKDIGTLRHFVLAKVSFCPRCLCALSTRVDSTVTVIVVTDRAIEEMIAKNSIEGFELSRPDLRRNCRLISCWTMPR